MVSLNIKSNKGGQENVNFLQMKITQLLDCC